MKNDYDFVVVILSTLLLCVIVISVNFTIVEALEYTFLGLGESFWGAFIGAIITGGIAIFIMNSQHRKQEKRDILNEENTLTTTKYLLKNINNFQMIEALIFIQKIRDKIKNISDDEMMKEAHIKFFYENEELLKNFIFELHQIRKNLVVYVSNKVIDKNSLEEINVYSKKIDSIIIHYNNINRFIYESKGEFQIFGQITDMLNSINDYKEYVWNNSDD